MEHTPGPWNYDFIWHRVIRSGGKEETICQLPDTPDSNADGRLISAAPDLLAFTKEAFEAFLVMNNTRGGIGKAGTLAGRMSDKARAAIAKAEGKE